METKTRIDMEILGSTQYQDAIKQKKPWYQLRVINRWDWITEPVCFENIRGVRISYCLTLNTPTSDTGWTSEVIKNITNEMKEVLLSKGLTLST